MKVSSTPYKIVTIWGSGAGAGYIRQIPVPSQQAFGNGGAASFTDGFPPVTFQQGSGVAPSGQDFNGILQTLSQSAQWGAAAGLYQWDPAFAAAIGGIGGYPQWACVTSATTLGRVWVSTVDQNTTNPDAGGAGWLALMLSSDVLALIAANAPKLVTASIVIYVSTSGSDSNPGTQAAPLATLAAAYKLGASYFVPGGQITIALSNPGTYAAASPPSGCPTPFVIAGSTSNQDAYIVSGTASSTGVFSHTTTSTVLYTGLTLQNAGNTTNTLGIAYGASVGLSYVSFTTTSGSFSQSTISLFQGGNLTIGAGIKTSNNASTFLSASGGRVANQSGSSLTFSGSPGYSTAVFSLSDLSVVALQGITISGAAAGPKWSISGNSVLDTGGNSANFPGSIAGTTSSGGVVI